MFPESACLPTNACYHGFQLSGTEQGTEGHRLSVVTVQLDQLRAKPQDLRGGNFNLSDLPVTSVRGQWRRAQTHRQSDLRWALSQDSPAGSYL